MTLVARAVVSAALALGLLGTPAAAAEGPRAAAAAPGSLLPGGGGAPPLPSVVVGEADVVPVTVARRLGQAGGAPTLRLSGPDRYATSAAVARSTHPGGAADVVLVSGEQAADGLVAAPLAARLAAPVLLVTGRGVPGVVAAELARLRPTRLTVVGGPAVVPSQVVAEAVAAAGSGRAEARATRIAGRDRYATAAAVAARWPSGVAGTVLATGAAFADGLAAGPVAAALGGPVLLTAPAALPEPTRGALARLRPARLLVAGGQDVVPHAVAAAAGRTAGRTAERVAGADRFATAAALAQVQRRVRPLTGVVVVTGLGFADALSAGAAAAATGQALLLTAGGPARSAALAADVGRLRGLPPWLGLTLDLLARAWQLPERVFVAYRAAYLADTTARLYGWDDPEVVTLLAQLRRSRLPAGGYGVAVPLDAFGDGSVNPATTGYLVTVTDHVGRALLDGLAAGAVAPAEVAALVELVLAWPTVAGDVDCLAYSDQAVDRRWCVYNVSSAAAWFLRRAWDLGVQRPGQLERASRLAGHDARLVDATGWWPYSSAVPGTRQDWNHNAAMVEAHLLLTPSSGQAALAATMAVGPQHPDPARRAVDDAMGYVRLLPFACDRTAGLLAAARSVAGRQRIASDTAQLALWSARTAAACE